ncbi:site-specific integrase [Streptomyces sp. RY43-2]|uniref:Site-specific integrase n=1 Tax=Streptomyces macrolidinus TaxID=2952607 RepID=A0ABT0ZLN6_9ACTN|nr:site-specific integrase [Streptomyces macrolidinus]MCN9244497.1 site-specific integrase [Streptomyces macrolidinus]
MTLARAVEQTVTLWTTMTSQGQMSPQTNRSFGQLLERWQRYTQARGAVLLNDVTVDFIEDFVFAHGRTRHGRIGESATATQHQRRAVLRSFYRTLRELGLTDTDPTRDVLLPERTRSLIRPLDEDEAVALRHAAEYVTRPSRHAAAAALALSGGHTGEIGHIRISDLDQSASAVWMHGSTRTDARWCPLDPWALRVLLARAAFVTRQQGSPEAVPKARLAVSSAPAPDEQLQARACVALSDLIRRIGLGTDPRVKPASLTAYAAVRIFSESGKIEDVARGLGLRSLDRAADLIGYDWTRPAAERQAASA